MRKDKIETDLPRKWVLKTADLEPTKSMANRKNVLIQLSA